MNSLDYNATLDQIVLSVRGCNEIWVIDQGTTTKEAASHKGGKQGKGGDLIYNPSFHVEQVGAASDAKEGIAGKCLLLVPVEQFGRPLQTFIAKSNP